jgi:hypothetical protein
MIAAQQLDVGVDALDGYIVAKNPDGEFIVHAEPIYG